MLLGEFLLADRLLLRAAHTSGLQVSRPCTPEHQLANLVPEEPGTEASAGKNVTATALVRDKLTDRAIANAIVAAVPVRFINEPPPAHRLRHS